MKFRLIYLLVGILFLGLTACTSGASPEPQITIEDPWVRAAVAMQDAGSGKMEGSSEGSMEAGESGMQMGGATSAAYMTIRNAGSQADRLLEVRSPVAEVVETHITQTRDGVASMSRVDGIDVPASSSVALEPGGMHIMLINLNQDLNPGDNIQLTLVFEQSGEIEVNAPVQAP